MHHKTPLRHPLEAYGLLSDRSEKDTAILFIHGFDGDPVKTWLQFQYLIDSDAQTFHVYSRCDLYFYCHDNVNKLLQDNALKFLGFIRSVFPKPQRDQFTFEPFSSLVTDSMVISLSQARIHLLPKEYSQVVLVGHSIGGALLRLAIWE